MPFFRFFVIQRFFNHLGFCQDQPKCQLSLAEFASFTQSAHKLMLFVNKLLLLFVEKLFLFLHQMQVLVHNLLLLVYRLAVHMLMLLVHRSTGNIDLSSCLLKIFRLAKLSLSLVLLNPSCLLLNKEYGVRKNACTRSPFLTEFALVSIMDNRQEGFWLHLLYF